MAKCRQFIDRQLLNAFLQQLAQDTLNADNNNNNNVNTPHKMSSGSNAVLTRYCVAKQYAASDGLKRAY